MSSLDSSIFSKLLPAFLRSLSLSQPSHSTHRSPDYFSSTAHYRISSSYSYYSPFSFSPLLSFSSSYSGRTEKLPPRTHSPCTPPPSPPPPRRQVALMTCLSGRLGRKGGPAPVTSAPDKLPNSSTSLRLASDCFFLPPIYISLRIRLFLSLSRRFDSIMFLLFM